ncbi:EthD family reductase [Nocardia sp. CA-119907]|uniref:EthD family reductase n=1 Tax=Nocardia sp. CA-119907 TaxID=3239973 RepID=UPI003D992FE0
MSTAMQNQRTTERMARFMVMYDKPSDIEAFERHYRDVHIPLARQLPGLRRYTVGHDATPVIGEPYYLVAMLDWDDMESLAAALSSEAGNRTAEDAMTNLSRYTTIRGMIVQLDDA